MLKFLGIVALVLVLAGAWAACCFVFGQDLKVVEIRGALLIDVQWLGEYASNVRRIRLSEEATGRVVWEVKAANGQSFPLWTILVREGPNSVLPEGLAGAEVVTPRGDVFELSAPTKYRVDLWTYKDWSVPRHVSRTFALPGKRSGA